MKQHQTLVLPCHAEGNPPPYVSWKRVGMEQPYREGEQRVSGEGGEGEEGRREGAAVPRG